MNPKLIPLYKSEGPAYPMGFPMCQNRLAPAVWSYMMEVHRPKQLIELGGGNRGFTTAIGMPAIQFHCQIHSFDHCESGEPWQDMANFFGIKFYVGDLFEKVDKISNLIRQPGTTFLLCDNGNKPKEFQLFAPYLKLGDVIAAHDYAVEGYWPWGEITPKDVSESVSVNGLEPFEQDYFDTVGWLAYRKTK